MRADWLAHCLRPFLFRKQCDRQGAVQCALQDNTRLGALGLCGDFYSMRDSAICLRQVSFNLQCPVENPQDINGTIGNNVGNPVMAI